MRIAFWLVFAAAMGVYMTMVAWSLPRISSIAGGLTPFDMRPGGYSFEEARALLTALGPEGSAFYRDVQQRLDLVYPPLITATLFLGIAILAPSSLGRGRFALAAIALPICLFDYLENAAVAHLLDFGPSAITPEAVGSASQFTVLKSGFSTVAMLALLVLVVRWAWHRARARTG